MSTILEELEPDAWPVAVGQRGMRSTGAAVGTATALLEIGATMSGARMMLFTAGAPTVGAGAVATLSLEDRMRQHVELQKGGAPLFAGADAYYDKISQRLAKNGHVCDLFACALDQLGLLEMRHLVEKTGGTLVNHEGFRGGVQGDVFTSTLLKMFEPGSPPPPGLPS
jgi:protein transport protein SEC23